MTRLVLFGAGLAAPPIIEKASASGQILAIADNDASKWGTTFHGYPVIPPRELTSLCPDRVIISATATFPIYNQLCALGVDSSLIESPLLAHRNRAHWDALKASQTGQRIFIVGNGPSLRTSDLQTLHDQRELSFAFNKIYLAFEETSYRPSFYLVEDDLVAKNNAKAIRALTGFQKFFPDYLLPVLGDPDEQTALFYFDVQRPEDFQPRFSEESLLVHSGYSCTYSALQLAIYMGFREIIFIGLDFYFTLPSQADDEVLTNEAQRNHFAPEYRKQGETWNRPYLDQTREAYILAKQVADRKGITILNASRSSELDVFPRVEFDSLFEAQ
ncbi:6-hydroxymethylpterin diphosphokinase MptE-like protein [Pelagicoccus sp. SDUM812005]|uniref:6-hydroxymethylpterin diphosphokinase MptE-like protein n=1 Tax=Pelagicoccus sp. SDUM812005 TaxID=3041257 RepID=UPI00280DCE10|nr:6-hydroxymethylpterin diphosphokinase MptE-like protein [Pelagicoccus sp. SDUM812005]MDQ8180941.1 DUF115 domain-containing protein [Pelagicoccus sp. SDUM812005]